MNKVDKIQRQILFCYQKNKKAIFSFYFKKTKITTKLDGIYKKIVSEPFKLDGILV